MLAVIAGIAMSAQAADFKSIADNAAIAYDAPSVKAKRLFVVSRDFPVEIMVSVDNWVKVRDLSGDLYWVERKALSDRRLVVVTAAVADIRQTAGDAAAVAFRAQKGVALELAETGADGWAKVRHRDGQSGFVRFQDVWGL
jgi:SH3-like domain-containing protein